MKRTTALALTMVIGLSILLVSTSDLQAVEDICQINWKKCRTEVLMSDLSTFVTFSALVACDLEKIACYLTLKMI